MKVINIEKRESGKYDVLLSVDDEKSVFLKFDHEPTEEQVFSEYERHLEALQSAYERDKEARIAQLQAELAQLLQ